MSGRLLTLGSLLFTAAVGGYYGLPFAGGGDRTGHLPGETTHGHKPIEGKCETCHTPFGGVKNDACNACHGADLEKSSDSHPESKFADPRNAERLGKLDASQCATCHKEHAPERTRALGVTVAEDFCVSCHADIAKERPSHEGFKADGCSASGCHNFHDNRALYEEFVGKHLREPDVLERTMVALRAEHSRPVRALTAADQDAPAWLTVDAKVIREWEETAHAQAGINCTGCHGGEGSETAADGWSTKLDQSVCARCHAEENDGFLRGRHGMRTAAGLSPMTPAMAMRPMKADAKGHALGCGSCHSTHSFDTAFAAVEGCVRCHDDDHTRAYPFSRHAKLWEAERSGKAEEGTGVSCATCHLPREVRREAGRDVVHVVHDQNENLRPNEKMIRGVCQSCHGLGFSIDALADADLVKRNFNGRPVKHVGSLEMVDRRVQEKSRKGGGK